MNMFIWRLDVFVGLVNISSTNTDVAIAATPIGHKVKDAHQNKKPV